VEKRVERSVIFKEKQVDASARCMKCNKVIYSHIVLRSLFSVTVRNSSDSCKEFTGSASVRDDTINGSNLFPAASKDFISWSGSAYKTQSSGRHV